MRGCLGGVSTSQGSRNSSRPNLGTRARGRVCCFALFSVVAYRARLRFDFVYFCFFAFLGREQATTLTICAGPCRRASHCCASRCPSVHTQGETERLAVLALPTAAWPHGRLTAPTVRPCRAAPRGRLTACATSLQRHAAPDAASTRPQQPWGGSSCHAPIVAATIAPPTPAVATCEATIDSSKRSTEA